MACQLQDRTIGPGFTQFPCGQSVLSHDDDATGIRFPAVQQTGEFQGGGIGPYCVMVWREHGEGSVGAGFVQFLSRGGTRIMQDRVIGLHGEDDAVFRMGVCIGGDCGPERVHPLHAKKVKAG